MSRPSLPPMTPEHSRLREAVIEATSTLDRVLTRLRLALSDGIASPKSPDVGALGDPALLPCEHAEQSRDTKLFPAGRQPSPLACSPAPTAPPGPSAAQQNPRGLRDGPRVNPIVAIQVSPPA